MQVQLTDKKETDAEPSSWIGLRIKQIWKKFYASSVSESTRTSPGANLQRQSDRAGSSRARASRPTCASETASQFDRNVFATLRLSDEFSMRSFIDSPCEN